MTLTMIFTASLLNVNTKEVVWRKKPESLFVVSVKNTFTGIPVPLRGKQKVKLSILFAVVAQLVLKLFCI